MAKGSKLATFFKIFQIKRLRSIFFLSFVLAVVLPLINVFVIHPNYLKSTISDIEDQTERLARHMVSEEGSGLSKLKESELTGEFVAQLKLLESDFRLMKIKVFTGSGETVYSSDPKEIGEINRKEYFHQVVAKGKRRTRALRKYSETSEGETLALDVVETYIPIMRDGEFIGAFEVYHDISPRVKALDAMIFNSSAVLLILTTSLMAAILIVSLRMVKAEEALREREERFRSVTESAPAAVISADGRGAIISWNRAAEGMFGYGADEVLGRPLTLLMPGRYRDAHTRTLQALRSREGEPALLETKVDFHGLRKDGREFPVELYLGSWWSRGEVFFSGIVLDVTERKRAEEEIRKSGDELKEAYETLKKAQATAIASEKLASLGRLTAGVSHEIRNPLNVIAISVHMMLREPGLAPKKAEDLEDVMEQVRRIEKITEDLLYVARHRPPERRALDLNNEAKRVLSLLERELAFQGVRVELALEDGLPEVSADQDQLQQVIFNLLSNARDVIPEGGGLRLATRALASEEAEAVELRVEDTGPGIPPDIMDKIFDPFFTTKPEGKGTGLGLSICHGIVEAHGGSLWAENLPGGGAAFAFRLPAGPAQERGGG